MLYINEEKQKPVTKCLLVVSEIRHQCYLKTERRGISFILGKLGNKIVITYLVMDTLRKKKKSKTHCIFLIPPSDIFFLYQPSNLFIK